MLSIHLAVPSCFNNFWHGVIPTSVFILNDFYTCFTHFSQQCIGIGNGEVTRNPREERALCAAPQCVHRCMHADIYLGMRILMGACRKLTIKWHPTKRKSQRGIWILPSEGAKHSLHTKDRSRFEITLFHVKIIVYRPF